ncbi:hypothetical protein BKA82DRAFT_4455342 [Pisolithus tinctorius]|nr:hypothetical protein BKA82DRAFT_4455342 [Pisolithus tinctorius]
MTVQKREWWSSPYLRIFFSPIRWYAISRRHMPSDFLIRLIPLQLPASRRASSLQVWMPDGLQHPKFKGRKGQLVIRIAPPRTAPKGIFHKLLATQISHLRSRIIQELQLLEGRLLHRSRHDDQEATVLRRLTRAEFKELRETGVVPHRNAVAVVVVPPTNRDRITRKKPAASIGPEIPSDDQVIPSASGSHCEVQLPLSTPHRVQCPLPEEDHPFSSLVPAVQVPLYNGLTMFPSAPQRAMLHKASCKVLDAERRSRLGQSSANSDGNRRKKSSPGGGRGSHAFLLVPNERAVKRGDSAPLAIALWKLRMWEGDAYQDLVCSSGWEVDGSGG